MNLRWCALHPGPAHNNLLGTIVRPSCAPPAWCRRTQQPLKPHTEDVRATRQKEPGPQLCCHVATGYIWFELQPSEKETFALFRGLSVWGLPGPAANSILSNTICWLIISLGSRKTPWYDIEKVYISIRRVVAEVESEWQRNQHGFWTLLNEELRWVPEIGQ